MNVNLRKEKRKSNQEIFQASLDGSTVPKLDVHREGFLLEVLDLIGDTDQVRLPKVRRR